MKNKNIQEGVESPQENESDSSVTTTEEQQAVLAIPVPAPDSTLYRYGATDHLLSILVDNPYAAFTVRELARATDYNSRSISQAVDVLAANDLVTTEHEGNKRLVSINRARLSKPGDRILGIPQPEFHRPVREAYDRLMASLADVRGIVVFGSVARGDADRQSDIDLWVLVGGEQATNQRKAHDIATELGNERFDGDRYDFQVLVESTTTAEEYGERLHDVFASGLTLYETAELRELKAEVLGNAD